MSRFLSRRRVAATLTGRVSGVHAGEDATSAVMYGWPAFNANTIDSRNRLIVDYH
jgi:hypothetical protein